MAVTEELNAQIFEKLELLNIGTFYSILAIHERLKTLIEGYDWTPEHFVMWLILYTPKEYPLKFWIDTPQMKIKRLK
jgi:hypothetical protein